MATIADLAALADSGRFEWLGSPAGSDHPILCSVLWRDGAGRLTMSTLSVTPEGDAIVSGGGE